MNGPRYLTTDIDNSDHTTDPGTMLPIPDSDIESIFMPICRKYVSGLAQFKNDSQRQQILDSYADAISILSMSKGQGSNTQGRYI